MWRKNLWTLVAAVILCGASYTMIVPFLPLYLLELGVSQANVKMWAGAVFAATFLVGALMAPYWGRRADRSGKRRMIMRAGISLGIVYFAGAWVRNPVELILVRVLQGIASGFVPASMALVASSAPPEKMGFCMGVMQTGLVIGGIIGPLMGGTLSHLFGMRMSFVVSAMILFAATAAVSQLVVEPKRTIAQEETSLLDDLKTAFGNQVLVRMLGLLFVVQIVSMTLQPLMALYVAELQGTMEGVGLTTGFIFSLSGAASAIAAPLWGRAGQGYNLRNLLVAAFVGAGVFNLSQYFATNIFQFGALQFLMGLFLIGVFPAINMIAISSSAVSFQGRVFGLTNASNQLGSMVGPLAGGFISSWTGIRPIFLLTGTTLALLGLFVFRTGLKASVQTQES
ncbi:MAG TPA: MFS transporter [Negativicutes bacterium]|nr:MFS transporter [Negativicutes bacterium]